MPSSRRLKVTGLAAFLTICIIFYVTHGASSTHNSAFYTRTVSAYQARQKAQAHADLVAEERHRLERVDRIEREHIAALSAAAGSGDEAESKPTPLHRGGSSPANANQRPIIPNGEYGEGKVADLKAGEKSVAGRKYMKDGKVVTYKPLEGDEDDGVAKVGNIGPQSSETADNQPHDEAVEVAFNEILRKGPIIIFSKTYCPFSRKAKHILLDLYSITPPPYVVELDEHKLGSSLQALLDRLTGRGTVPNVLINGKSIGGGDDVEGLHKDDKLVSTILSMGGKRMTKVQRLDEEVKKSEMRFKA